MYLRDTTLEAHPPRYLIAPSLGQMVRDQCAASMAWAIPGAVVHLRPYGDHQKAFP